MIKLREPRTGLHFARHAGARIASGQVIVYVDDDVVAPAGWLQNMLSPYENPRIGAVGGRTVPLFEQAPPGWLMEVAASHLSILDLGEEGCFMQPPRSPYGCNMSLRKSLLFKYGGFHPDAFADPKRRWLRGDGENALIYRLQRDGWLVWYSPDAWLYHRVPASRMTVEYLRRRAFNQGMSNSFAEYRRHPMGPAGLLGKSFLTFTEGLLRQGYATTATRRSARIHRRLAAAATIGKACHTARMGLDPSLREHVLKPDFLDK